MLTTVNRAEFKVQAKSQFKVGLHQLSRTTQEQICFTRLVTQGTLIQKQTAITHSLGMHAFTTYACMHACMHTSNILETRLLFFYFIFKCLFLFVCLAQISHASNQKSHQEFTVRCSLLFSASEISIWEDDRFWNTFFFFFSIQTI